MRNRLDTKASVRRSHLAAPKPSGIRWPVAACLVGFLSGWVGPLAARADSSSESETKLRMAISPLMPVIATDAVMEDKHFSLMVDTGSSFLVLDPSFQNLAKGEVDTAAVTGAGGQVEHFKEYKIPVIRAQSLVNSQPVAFFNDLHEVSAYMGVKFTGILGINELSAGGKILFDYEHGWLEVHGGGWKLAGADCHELPLQESADIPFFSTQLAGQDVMFLLDSGSNGCIDLPADLFNRLATDGSIEVFGGGGQELSLGNTNESLDGRFVRGELMGKSLAGVAVSRTQGAGKLGLKWLCGFNTEIDFPARKVRYQVAATAKPPVSVEWHLGTILFYDESGPHAQMVMPGGAADSAGLQPGDAIEQFDGVKAAELDATKVTGVLVAKAGGPVEVRVVRKADGARATIQLMLPKLQSVWSLPSRREPPAKE